MTRDQSEAGNRLDHITLIGTIQNQLLSFNPHLHTRARVGDGRTKLGWKSLQQNNVSRDVSDPVTVNKTDIFISMRQVLGDTDDISVSVRDQEHDRHERAAVLLQANPTPNQLRRFVKQIADSDGAERIEASRNSRGTHSFRVPFSPEPRD
jgi:hypothetical protein